MYSKNLVVYVCVNAAWHFSTFAKLNMSNVFILKPIFSNIVSNGRNYN